MDLTDLFDGPKAKNPETSPQETSGGLSEDLTARVKTAVEAHDVAKAAQASFDNERARLEQELEDKLGSEAAKWKVAREASKEALDALAVAMKKEKITQIPLTDRPDIKIKVTKGRKKSVTRTWLVDPKEIVVKSFDAALKGEKPFANGVEAAKKIWAGVPSGESKSEVIIPSRYEDEPDHG